MQQILHVLRVDAILGVVLDDLVADEQRLVRVGCAETVEGKTTGQTGDGAEQRFESLGEMMGDVVLVNLQSDSVYRTSHITVNHEPASW